MTTKTESFDEVAAKPSRTVIKVDRYITDVVLPVPGTQPVEFEWYTVIEGNPPEGFRPCRFVITVLVSRNPQTGEEAVARETISLTADDPVDAARKIPGIWAAAAPDIQNRGRKEMGPQIVVPGAGPIARFRRGLNGRK